MCHSLSYETIDKVDELSIVDLISDKQLDLNRSLHKNNSNFGNRPSGSGLAAKLPFGLIRMNELGICNSVLDYGTGKGLLVDNLKSDLPKSINVSGYDPAVDKWSNKPKSTFDILTCLDVLEHVELNKVQAVLHDINELTKYFCFITIDLQPAVKTLKDGRNAHIMLAPHDWWLTRISQIFPCIASFPIMNKSGFAQKTIITATQYGRYVPYMYSFLNKLNIYALTMNTGKNLSSSK